MATGDFSSPPKVNSREIPARASERFPGGIDRLNVEFNDENYVENIRFVFAEMEDPYLNNKPKSRFTDSNRSTDTDTLFGHTRTHTDTHGLGHTIFCDFRLRHMKNFNLRHGQIQNLGHGLGHLCFASADWICSSNWIWLLHCKWTVSGHFKSGTDRCDRWKSIFVAWKA